MVRDELDTAAVGKTQIDSAQIGIVTIGIAEVYLYSLVLYSPLIPYLHTLFEDIKNVLLSHKAYLLKRVSCNKSSFNYFRYIK